MVPVSEATQRLSEFEQLARAFATAPDENARLQLAVDSAVALVDSCDHAGITVNAGGRPFTRVSSDEVVRRANELQYELGDGPCLNFQRDQDTIVVTDLATDERWPVWAPKVHHELGARSMLSLLVFTDGHPTAHSACMQLAATPSMSTTSLSRRPWPGTWLSRCPPSGRSISWGWRSSAAWSSGRHRGS